jgi:hypothetical protein
MKLSMFFNVVEQWVSSHLEDITDNFSSGHTKNKLKKWIYHALYYAYEITEAQFHKYTYWGLLYLSYAIFFIAYLDVITIHPKYLDLLQNAMKYYIGIFLMIRYNPYLKSFHKPMTSFDKHIVFSAGFFLIFTTAVLNFTEEFIKQNIIDELQHKLETFGIKLQPIGNSLNLEKIKTDIMNTDLSKQITKELNHLEELSTYPFSTILSMDTSYSNYNYIHNEKQNKVRIQSDEEYEKSIKNMERGYFGVVTVSVGIIIASMISIVWSLRR